MKAKDYNLDWFKYFKYDETSPSCLVWNCPRFFKGRPNYDRIGKPVGSLMSNGYWSVGLGDGANGKHTYLLHRIIAVMFHGEIDIEMDVDHINRNKSDNKISNIRIVSKSKNMTNKDVRPDNQTGYTGVSIECGGYRASYTDECGKNYRKFFSISKYGESAALQMAVQWRSDKVRVYNE